MNITKEIKSRIEEISNFKTPTKEEKEEYKFLLKLVEENKNDFVDL